MNIIIILAAIEYIIEDTDRQKARSDLDAANIRQGCMRAEEAFEQHFDPAVHIARLEDTQYADKLLKCLNDDIHKKMAKANLKGLQLQTDMRAAFGPDRWNIPPAQARRDTINRDLAKLAIACDDPYNTGEYLIGEEVAAAMSEEAVLFEKVNATRQQTGSKRSMHAWTKWKRKWKRWIQFQQAYLK